MPAIFLAAVLRAEDVLIITGDSGPLQDQILNGLRAGLTASHKEVPIGADIASAGAGAQVIVALGAAAADKARAASSLPLVVTGVPNLFDKDWTNAVKVHVDLRPEDLIKSLKEVRPQVKTVGIIRSATKSNALMARINQAATAAGVAVMESPCNTTDDIAAALRSMAGKTDAFWMIMDPIALSPVAVDLIFQFSSTQKVFLIAPLEAYVQRGAAMALTGTYAEVGALAAEAAQAAIRKSARKDYFIRQPQLFLNEAALTHLGVGLTPDLRAKIKRLY